MLTRATTKGWSDGLVKIVTVVGGALIILSWSNNFFGWSVGGLLTGNKVETETLATATKVANDAMTDKVKAVDTKVTEMQSTLKEMNTKLDRVPLMDQTLTAHTERLRALDDQTHDLVEKLTGDEKLLSALVPGFAVGVPSPQIRQPPRRQ